MYRIAKRFYFSASHQIEGLPEGHPCGRLHGHNYTVILYLQSETLNEVGFVRDFGELTEFKALIDSLDHRHLNDLLPATTAEFLARWLYERAKQWYPETVAVRVYETDQCWAEYRESGEW